MATLEQIIEEARKLPAEQQRRLRTALENATSDAGAKPSHRMMEREHAWIEKHRNEYLGQWVALEGDNLIAHGSNPRQVYLAARAAGIAVPYVERVEKRADFYTGGWL
jgi:Family of unknown function (DUF5678)